MQFCEDKNIEWKSNKNKDVKWKGEDKEQLSIA